MHTSPLAQQDAVREAVLDLVRTDTGETQQLTALHRLAEAPADELLLILQRHRLDQLVLHGLQEGALPRLLKAEPGLAQRLDESITQPLRAVRRRQALSLMLRQEAASSAGRCLEAAGVDYVLFKGILLGELLYGDPLLRPSADVDVLFDEADRPRAHAALLEAGFEPAPQPDQPAYELSYVRQGANLDVHWHPIEPGRSRVPLTPCFLEGRQQRDGLWYPPHHATFLALLLNPAISDYVSERLIQPLDLDRFLRKVDVDLAPAVSILHQAGLATAGWVMLEYTRRLFGTPIPETLDTALHPGPWRRRHLRRWLDRDPAKVYLHSPWKVRASFSLLLHDRPIDGLRALWASLKEKWRTRHVRR